MPKVTLRTYFSSIFSFTLTSPMPITRLYSNCITSTIWIKRKGMYLYGIILTIYSGCTFIQKKICKRSVLFIRVSSFMYEFYWYSVYIILTQLLDCKILKTVRNFGKANICSSCMDFLIIHDVEKFFSKYH